VAQTIITVLDPAEVHTCEILSALRHANHLTRVNGQALGGSMSGRDEDAQGLLGEYAVGKAINRWVPFVVADPWETVEHDVGRLYQVRATVYRGGHLIVQEKDHDDHVFILSRLRSRLPGGSLEVEVGGWIWGRDAKKLEWKRVKPRVRSAAFFVPPARLAPMSQLPDD
jgi:hypothetical protein